MSRKARKAEGTKIATAASVSNRPRSATALFFLTFASFARRASRALRETSSSFHASRRGAVGVVGGRGFGLQPVEGAADDGIVESAR